MDTQIHVIFECLQNLAKETQLITDLILNQDNAPEPVGNTQELVSEYIPTSKNYAPKPLTI